MGFERIIGVMEKSQLMETMFFLFISHQKTTFPNISSGFF